MIGRYDVDRRVTNLHKVSRAKVILVEEVMGSVREQVVNPNLA